MSSLMEPAASSPLLVLSSTSTSTTLIPTASSLSRGKLMDGISKVEEDGDSVAVAGCMLECMSTPVCVLEPRQHRLKQHNGELKGGAKASRAGRPWTCACVIRGFNDQSEACSFESKWKNLSRKLPRKRNYGNCTEASAIAVLQHRKEALDRLKILIDCSHLYVDLCSNMSC